VKYPWFHKYFMSYFHLTPIRVFKKCDIAILRAVESRKDESEEANRAFEEAIDALRQYASTYTLGE